MSGAEPLAVLGAISSVITIIETSKEVYDAAKDARGLHESFRKASDHVSIILSTLHQAKSIQEQAVRVYEKSNDVEQKRKIEEESRAVEPIMSRCKTNAESLSNIFATIALTKDMSRMRRYAIAIESSMPSKKWKVQSLMRETMEGLQLLHTYHSFSTMTTSKQLQSATQQSPTRNPISDGYANHPTFHEGLRRADDGRLAVSRKQMEHKDFKATESPGEESLSRNENPHNVWMNASGTKVMNQVGAQTVHGTQNFTL